MATPDVRVRLSAEGVKEVVDALKRIKSEADKAGGASKGIGRLNSALGGLKSLLPALGVGVAVAGIVNLGRRAIETGDQLDEMAQKTGATVEKLSVLFTLPDFVGQEEAVSKTLNKFSRTLDDFAGGSPAVVEAFERIGLSAQDLAGLDTFDAFVKTSERLGSFEDGVGKAAVAMDLFGKQGADLLPGINALSEEGFQNLEDKARAAGLIMSGETAAAAAKLKDDLALLEKQAQGLATEFLSGFAPAVSEAMGTFSEATSGEGVGAMKTLGRIAGAIIQTISSAFVGLGNIVAAVIAGIVVSVEGAGAVLDQAKNFEFGAALDTARSYRASQKSIVDQLANELSAQADKVGAAWSTISGADVMGEGAAAGGKPDKKPAIGGPGAGAAAIAKARAAAAVAEAENRLALIRAQNALEEGENKRAFDAGLRSLEDYYAKRRSLIESEAAAELAVLRAKLGAAAGAPAKDAAEAAKRDQDAAKIRNEILIRELELEGELADLAADRTKSEKEAGEARLEAEKAIAEIQGDRYRSALISLEQEIAKTDELLRKQGLAAAEREAILAQQRAQGEAAIGFAGASGQGRAVFDELAAERERLGGLTDAGQMAPIEAEGRLLAIQEARLPVLRQIADEMMRLAAASGDLDLKAEADEFSAAVDSLAVATSRTINLSAQLKQTVFEAGTSALANFFTTGIKGAENLGDAFREMAAGVADAIANMLAQMLALQIMTMIFKAMGIPVPKGYAEGGIVKMATGGYVSGPGTGTSDSIPALLSDGEFVNRAAVVNQPGALEFLERFNAEGMGALRSYTGAARYADGGLVGEGGGMGGTAGRDGRLDIGLEEGLIVRHLGAPAVVRQLQKIVASNPRGFNRK